MLFVLVAGSSTGVHDLEYHLSVLNSVDGVTGANHFGVDGDRTQQYGVHLKVRAAPGAPRKMMYEVKYEDDNRVRGRCVGY